MNHFNAMRSFRHTVSVCLLSVAFCSLASAQDGVGQQPQKDAPPSAPSLTPSDDLGSAMEKFAIDLQMFFSDAQPARLHRNVWYRNDGNHRSKFE